MSRRARQRSEVESSKWIAWQTERDDEFADSELPEPESDDQYHPESEQ